MIPPSLRVVLDVNIFVSAFFFSGPDAAPRRVYNAAMAQKFRFVYSTALVDNLRCVLGKEKFKDRLLRVASSVDELIEIITDLGDLVQPIEVPPNAVRDADDALILACAIGGKVNFIITGDDDLLSLVVYEGIQILTPMAFLPLISPTE